MAQAQLDNILDALKLVPLDLSRSLALIYQLDRKTDQNNNMINTIQSNILNKYSAADIKLSDKLHDELSHELHELRELQSNNYCLCNEKYKITDEIKLKIYSYIQRIDEDMEQISTDHPHMVDQYIQHNEPIFDAVYSGQRAASKGLMIGNKSPVYNDMNNINDNNDAIYAPPRRRAANNAIDMIRSEMSIDDEDSDEYIDTNANKQFKNLVMTNTVNMNEIELVDPIQSDDKQDQALYCTCQQPSYGEMVGCDNETCPYEWFHLSCVGLKKPPKASQKWYCYDCTQQLRMQQQQQQQS